ncbi:MAG TPA: gliding motility-associated ABC transporter ATP-binding subunit GldA [Bacteroidia bacterium]
MSIKVENITKLYGAQKALNEVSFEIKTGEVVGFLGPNGAGKSTMMKILTCFIPQTSGNAWVCGYDVNEQSLDVRRNVGYLPENNPLYLDMYVKEYLEFIAGLHKVKNVNERIKEMIRITGLEVEQRKKIGALSRGYRQRVGLAQALIHDPQVLILDEPTSGLDPNQLAEIRNLIVEIGKEKTVMLSTHIMQEVEAVCDRVIIIREGSLRADDTTENVKQTGEEQQVITVEFQFNANSASAQEARNKMIMDSLRAMDGVQDVILTKENTFQVVGNTERDLRPDIFQFAVKNNLSVLTMQREERKLEDVFKDLTK